MQPETSVSRRAGSQDPPTHRATQPDHPTEWNFFRLLGQSPAALKGYRGWESALAGGQLTARQREQIALAVAEMNGSAYDLSAHRAVARSLGLSEEEVRQARKATASSARDAAMLRFTRVVTLQRGNLGRTDLQAVRQAGFSEAQIIEIVACIAQNIFANYFNSIAGTDIDFPFVKPGFEPM